MRVEFDDRLTPAAPVIVVAEAGLIIASCGISEAVLIESVTAVAPELDLSSVVTAYETARLESAVDADPTTPIPLPALPALAGAGAPVPPPPPPAMRPPVYRNGEHTWPSLPAVPWSPAEVLSPGSTPSLGAQRTRHVPWRAPIMCWSAVAVFVALLAWVALPGPLAQAPFGGQGDKAPGQNAPVPVRGRRAVGAAGTAGVPVAPAPATPRPSATPTPSPSASRTASAPPSPSPAPQPSGAPSGSAPPATPTVPPTPSPSTSEAPPPPVVVTSAPDPVPPSVSEAPPIQGTLCDPLLIACP